MPIACTRRSWTTLETVERVHIAPLHARADGLLDEVERITDKVKHAQDSVSDAFKQMAGTGNAVAWALKSRTWPIIGVLQGLEIGRERRHEKRPEEPGRQLSRRLCRFLLHLNFANPEKSDRFVQVRALQWKRATGFLSGSSVSLPIVRSNHKLGRRPADASSRLFFEAIL